MMDAIAERRLLIELPDCNPSEALVRVGRPMPADGGDYTCAVEADGFTRWSGRSHIVGVDSWHALVLALRFLRTMLEAEVAAGAVFHDVDGGPLDVSELFALHVAD